MILGFNIGNSNTILGVYRGNEFIPAVTFSYPTHRHEEVPMLGTRIRGFLSGIEDDNFNDRAIRGLAFSSVVPELNSQYLALGKLLESRNVLQIGPHCLLGITINYDTPENLGVDRIVNAEAAYQEYRRDSIIIDAGTAVTFCVLHGDGTYDGGIISPGAGISGEALARETSQLGRVPLQKPPSLVARNTVDALKSGLFYGWVAMIDGICTSIEQWYHKPFFRILTGGYAEILGEELRLRKETQIDTLLTMKGIMRIYSLNCL